MEEMMYVEDNTDLLIISANMKKQVNEHSVMSIIGSVQQEGLEAVRNYAYSGKNYKVYARDDKGNSKLLFSGMLKKYEEVNEDYQTTIKIDLISTTYKMDVKKDKRIFQNIGSTYTEIIDYILRGYEETAEYVTPGLGAATSSLILQYDETDWDFIKRMASEKNSFIISRDESKIISIGLDSSGELINIEDKFYTKSINRAEYFLKKASGLIDAVAEEEISLETREIYGLGSKVNVANDREYYIYSVIADYKDYVCKCTYKLKRAIGFKTPRVINYGMIGVSLIGNVSEVTKDKVTVDIKLDGIQDGKYNFDFATPYSSGGGAGWYCMPEKGDEVRVYFPSENTTEAYVINATQVGNSDDDSSIKYFKNPQGKQIIFAPTYLKITNNDGVNITIDDTDGVTIESNLPVNIMSDGKILTSSTGDSIIIEADNSIDLTRRSSSIEIKDDVTMTASQIHMKKLD